MIIILFKVTIFVLCVFFSIWMSNYDPQLHAELNYVRGPLPRKQPNQLLNVMLIFLILLGGGIAAYFVPLDTTGITVGSILGLLTMSAAGVVRDSIHN